MKVLEDQPFDYGNAEELFQPIQDYKQQEFQGVDYSLMGTPEFENQYKLGNYDSLPNWEEINEYPEDIKFYDQYITTALEQVQKEEALLRKWELQKLPQTEPITNQDIYQPPNILQSL